MRHRIGAAAFLAIAVACLGFGCSDTARQQREAEEARKAEDARKAEEAREAAAIAKARTLVEKEAGVVWRLAHPTAKYEEFKFDGYDKTANGYLIKYTYMRSKKDTEHKTTLGFRFNLQGTLSGIDVEDVIAVLSDSSWVKPFLAADVVSGTIREELKKRIDKIPTDVNGELKDLLNRNLGAKGLAALWLVYREAYPKEEAPAAK